MTTALLALTLTVIPHTVGEIEDWLADWEHRVSDGLGDGVAEGVELRDFADRHPWWFFPEVSPPSLTAATTRGGMGGNVAQWRTLVASYFPADQVDKALAVMACESGGNPAAANPRSSARGLMQILASLWAPHFGIAADALYDPETNIRVARKIWDLQGWGAWTCA